MHVCRRYILIATLMLVVLNGISCTAITATPDPLAAADDLVASGEYTAAEAAYYDAWQAWPDSPQPALRLALLYRRWNRPEAGLTALDEAIRRGANPDKIAPLRLEILSLTHNWPQIATEAEKQLAAVPHSRTALHVLVEAQLNQHRCKEAAETARQWYSAARNDTAAAKTWAILNGDFEFLCKADAQWCATLQSCTPQCALYLGQALIRHNEWPLAACVLDRAVASQPESAAAHTWLGEALGRLGFAAEAQSHLEKATQLAPESPLEWLLLGTHSLHQQQNDVAEKALLRAHNLDPQNPVPCLALAEVMAQTGRYKEITPWIEAAAQSAPTDTEIWKAIAHFYLERHIIEAEYPLRAILSAIQLDPDDAEAQRLLGWYRLMIGDTAGALSAFDASITLSPNQGATHYLRGQALQALGDTEAAQRAFIRANDLGYQL